MIDSHRFFCNRACRYFPCHSAAWARERPGDFNCLFCFCPLYFLEDCGGSPSWVGPGGRIKDCSGCDLPHAPGGYDRVMGRLKRHFSTLRGATEPKHPASSDDENG